MSMSKEAVIGPWTGRTERRQALAELERAQETLEKELKKQATSGASSSSTSKEEPEYIWFVAGKKLLLAKKYGPDSYYFPDFLAQAGLSKEQQDELAKVFLENKDLFIDRDDPSIKYRGHKLKRSKLFMKTLKMLGLYPFYRYPGATIEGLKHLRDLDSVPGMTLLASILESLCYSLGSEEGPRVNFRFNHVIGTWYADQDTIGWHSDDMTSIEADTFIPILSFGCTRVLQLCPTPPPEEKGKAISPSKITSIPMPQGALFILGPKTNACMQHRVPPVDEEPASLKLGETRGPRFSLVFRLIKEVYTEKEWTKMRAKAAKGKEGRERAKAKKKAEESSSSSSSSSSPVKKVRKSPPKNKDKEPGKKAKVSCQPYPKRVMGQMSDYVDIWADPITGEEVRSDFVFRHPPRPFDLLGITTDTFRIHDPQKPSHGPDMQSTLTFTHDPSRNLLIEEHADRAFKSVVN